MGRWVGDRDSFRSIENTKFPFRVYSKILIPYSSFSRSDQTNFENFLAHVFSGILDFRDFEKHISCNMFLDVLN